MLSDAQLREAFHFSFLARLLKISDPGLYVLKGGVNLRFYFGSPRYSEYMDLDVVAGSVPTLKKNGYKILHDAAFQRSLRVFDIDEIVVNDPQKAKHTATTQRFACSLVRASGVRLPTKVEFSRRNDDPGDEAPVHSIDPDIALPYRRLAYHCRHYDGPAAVRQKIEALAGRAVTQARDVFDLDILVRGGHFAEAAKQGRLEGAPLARALRRVTEIDWDAFRDQVIEYLDADARETYGTPEAWGRLQAAVLDMLSDHA